MSRNYILNNSNLSSSINYSEDLNSTQFDAVTSPGGPSLVIAGAGSGKTRTLIYRVAYLIGKGVSPKNILLLTFTNKASKEMIDRVDHLIGSNVSNSIWAGTFHSIGAKILRNNVTEIGWEQNFSIIDKDDQKSILKEIISSNYKETNKFPKAEVISNIISLSNNTNTDINSILDERYPYFSCYVDEIEYICKNYKIKKKESNCFDFDDLLIYTLKILKDVEDIRRYYQSKFKWVLVDEYQDTNYLQIEIIKILSLPQNNLMVVGDDSQSIYSWRGANINNIIDFDKVYPNSLRYVIETNYRSVPEILSFANNVIASNNNQIRKKLSANRKGLNKLPALVPLQTPELQASFISQRILELNREGVDFKDIAVLYRAHFNAMELQINLTRNNIPFSISSGVRFFDQIHIKDVVAFIRFVFNPKDESAFKRMVSILPGVGSKTANKIWDCWFNSDGYANSGIKKLSNYFASFKPSKKLSKDWMQFLYTLDEFFDDNGNIQDTSLIIHSVLEGLYRDYMRSKFVNHESREKDIEELESFVKKFDSLEDCITQLNLISEPEENNNEEINSTDKISLSSIHQAKGLEWKVVFIIWLVEGVFPNDKVISESSSRLDSIEEERRIFYVAITRAQDELYLTYPMVLNRPRNGEFVQKPSRFLEEIPSKLREDWSISSF